MNSNFSHIGLAGYLDGFGSPARLTIKTFEKVIPPELRRNLQQHRGQKVKINFKKPELIAFCQKLIKF